MTNVCAKKPKLATSRRKMVRRIIKKAEKEGAIFLIKDSALPKGRRVLDVRELIVAPSIEARVLTSEMRILVTEEGWLCAAIYYLQLPAYTGAIALLVRLEAP